MYVISRWNETFENADTRKRVRLGWFHCPSGTDSSGYIELMSHGEDGIKAFAVFLAICQWSATCLPHVRGRLARSSGKPADERQIAAMIRMPIEVVSRSLELLSDVDIGWIVKVEDEEQVEKPKEIDESATCLPVVCQSPASSMPQGKGKGQGEGEGQEEGKGSLSGKAERDEYPEDFETFWLAFPKRKRSKKGEAYRKWKLHFKKVGASTLIEAAREYADSDLGRSEYAVMPSVWLNSHMWEDDREAWKRNGQRTSTTKQDDGLNYGQRALKRLRDD